MQNNNIKLIEDIERFKDLKEEWDLLYNCAIYPVFQSFSFNYAAWQFQLSESKKNQLKIVVIFNDNQLVAIFPLYLDSKKCLRFIADIILSLLSPPDRKKFLVIDEFSIMLQSNLCPVPP